MRGMATREKSKVIKGLLLKSVCSFYVSCEWIYVHFIF